MCEFQCNNKIIVVALLLFSPSILHRVILKIKLDKIIKSNSQDRTRQVNNKTDLCNLKRDRER